MKVAFEESKSSLESCISLGYPRPDTLISLTKDASNTGVGGVLEQYENGFWRPLGFFSKQ